MVNAMTDAQINETLVKAVGFKYIRPTGVIIAFWKYPDGYTDRILPDFPNDMNACLKWLWPNIKADITINNCCPQGFYCQIFRQSEFRVDEVAESMPRAFCLAAIKYFEVKK